MNISTTINQLELSLQPINAREVLAMTLPEYLINYRTIGLSLPRGTGKTAFLVNRFVQTHSLLVVPNQILKQSVTREHPRLAPWVVSASEGSGNRYFGIGQRIRPFEYILIDEPLHHPKHFNYVDFLNGLCNNLLVDTNTTIIKLGTM